MRIAAVLALFIIAMFAASATTATTVPTQTPLPLSLTAN